MSKHGTILLLCLALAASTGVGGAYGAARAGSGCASFQVAGGAAKVSFSTIKVSGISCAQGRKVLTAFAKQGTTEPRIYMGFSCRVSKIDAVSCKQQAKAISARETQTAMG